MLSLMDHLGNLLAHLGPNEVIWGLYWTIWATIVGHFGTLWTICWSNLAISFFLHVTDEEKCQISPHPCIEIWNFFTLQFFSSFGNPTAPFGDPAMCMGDPTGPFGDPTGPFEDPNGPFGDPTGPFLGAQLNHFGILLGHFWTLLYNLGIYWIILEPYLVILGLYCLCLSQSVLVCLWVWFRKSVSLF